MNHTDRTILTVAIPIGLIIFLAIFFGVEFGLIQEVMNLPEPK